VRPVAFDRDRGEWSSGPHKMKSFPTAHIKVSRHYVYQFMLGLAIVSFAHEARALCVDPRDPTASTYYFPTVRDEVLASNAIVIGTVSKVLPLKADLSDPNAVMAFAYTVKVSKRYKGTVPEFITLRAENDSGGFIMETGLTYILFLTKLSRYFSVDACGHSQELPKSNALLKQVQAELR
jgi:hypothetical protein